MPERKAQGTPSWAFFIVQPVYVSIRPTEIALPVEIAF
jgi:hypothetical protein